MNRWIDAKIVNEKVVEKNKSRNRNNFCSKKNVSDIRPRSVLTINKRKPLTR